MPTSQKEYSAKIYQRLLLPSLWVSLFFIIFLIRSIGGIQGLLSSKVSLITFAIMLMFGIFTFWLQRQTVQNSPLFGFITTIVQKGHLFHITLILLVIAISSGVNILLLPAYHAYQLLINIPLLFPLITPFLGWLTTQLFLFYLIILVLRVTNSEPSNRSIASYLWLSFGGMLLFLYLNSIFIVWFELRGFRLF